MLAGFPALCCSFDNMKKADLILQKLELLKKQKPNAKI